MLDDHDSQVRALPTLNVFDRGELERYLATLEAHAEALEARLEVARERQVVAERARTEAAAQLQRDLAAALSAAQVELAAEAERHEAALAQVRDDAAAEARRILQDAEREALDLRIALGDVLDELDDSADELPAPAPVRLAVVPDPVVEPSRPTSSLAPVAPPVLRPAVSLGRRVHPSNKHQVRGTRRYPLRTG